MPDLEIHLLGPFEVFSEGQLVRDFKTNKASALLAYLVCETDSTHLRQDLTSLFWPEIPQEEAREHLGAAISGLSQTLDDPQSASPYLLITPESVQFNPAGACRVDLWNLRRALADGSLPKLKSGLSLYRSRFLDGFQREDCPAFETWLSLQREGVQNDVIMGLYRLAAHYEVRCDYEMALFAVEQVRAIDPLGEDSYRRMMHLLALNGQRDQAMEQYQLCCQVLRKELGVEPSREIATLYKAIRSQSFPPPPSGPRWDSLPRQTTPFVGREAALRTLDALLLNAEIPLVTIHGPGGIGKTRLALQAAMAQRTRFRDGVYFIRLGPLNDPEQLVPAIAAATGFYFYQGAEDQETQLFNYLRNKILLLVVDNFEHLSAGAPFIADLLQAAPEVRVLATSDHRLNLPFETVFTLDGMDCALPSGSLDAARPESARLFIQCARRVSRDFELRAEDLAEIGRICRLVGGNPLGIVMVAPWVSSHPLYDIANAIQQGIDSIGAQELLDQQASIRAAFNQSWNMLSTREQDFLMKLAVFRGGFTFQAAQEILEATLIDLRELENKALIQYNFAVGRYEFHNIVWRFAFERLATHPQVHQQVNAAHSTWYIATLEDWFTEAQGSRQLTTLQLIEWDIENIRAAWDWEIARGHTLNLERALNGLCFYYQWRGQYQDGETLCFLTAQRLRMDLPPTAPSSTPGFRLLARVLAWRSVFSLGIGHLRRADEYLNESMQVYDLNHQDGFFLRQVGDCLVNTSCQEARRCYEKSLAICREGGDRWGEAHALGALGWAAFDSGCYPEARDSLMQSLNLLRELGDHFGMAKALRGLGSTAIRQGQFIRAEKFLRECIQLVKETRNQAELARGLSALGWVMVLDGKFQQGGTSIAESIEIWSTLGAENQKAHLHTALGLAELHQGRVAEALDEIHQSLELAQNHNNPKALAFAHWGLGWAHLLREDLEAALVSALESERGWREAGTLEDLGQAQALLGTIACRQGRWAQARQYLRGALENTLQQHVLLPLLYAAPALGLCFTLEGKPVMHTRIHALATSYPLITRSYLFKDITQQMYASHGIPHDLSGSTRKHPHRPVGQFLNLAVELLEALC